MQDTPANIVRMQKEIFMSKSPGERLRICLQMTDFARTLTETKIKAKTPDITASSLKAEVFKLFYKDYFSEKDLAKIALWLKNVEK